MKTLIATAKAVFSVALLAACGYWVLLAWLDFILTVGDHMDDGGCYAGHPGWASLQLAVALLGAAAAGVCVYFLVKDGGPSRAAWGLAGAELSFVLWRELLVAGPHAQVVAARC
jgi:hypothetical protein